MLNCREDVLRFTKQLVQVNSVVNTLGEQEIANTIYQTILSFPYFKEHRDQVMLQNIPDDKWHRSNVLAYVKGTKSNSNNTIILMGHMDTVGIDDFSYLKAAACDPDKLMQELQHEELTSLVQQQLESGDWLFGRGVLDMKSGVASNLYLLNYYSEHPELLAGNLVFVAECDEEDSSLGIQSAVKLLNQWKDKYGFEYVAAINADFVSPRNAGDDQRYIYKGTVGKLLPAFYIVGAETHVGSCFDGLDPNLLAAELTRQIDYNPDLSDEALGELTLPPVSLKQSDLKKEYTVQTAISTYVYYNFFTHSWSPKDVLEKLKRQAQIAFTNALTLLESRYLTYCMRSGDTAQKLPWKPRVMMYEEIIEVAIQQHGGRFIQHLEQFKAELLLDTSLDIRAYALRVVEEVWDWTRDRDPVIILFYASLHFPRVELLGESGAERSLIEAMEYAISQVQPHYPHPIVTKNFFPHISDMSFVSVSDDDANLLAESKNNPATGTKINVNYEEIRALNVPVINIGPYGSDAHKKYERMEMTFSLECVPNLTNLVIQKLLDK